MNRSHLIFSFLTSLIFTCASLANPLVNGKRQTDWHKAETMAENAVAQVLAQHTEFNWLEPYKAPRKSQSYGTAFFLDDNGYLLTNFHVINQASLQLFIPALGQKPIDAFLVGTCPEADLAIIKVGEVHLKSVKAAIKKVPFLKLGDSDSLVATEPVLALGYPMGQRYLKSTVGVVAGREYLAGQSFMHITAPLNPGNSGGPLLNLDGHVVGINSAVHSHATNIGYIIPIYDAQILLNEMKKNKLVRKPYLGISVNRTTDAHARLLGNPEPTGVYIHDVEAHSVAEKAGVQVGDMLYEINGHEVDSYGDVTVNWKTSRKVTLSEFLLRQAPHATLKLTIYRKGQKKIITCTFGAASAGSVRTVYAEYEPHETDFEIIGGMCVMQLRLNHLEYFEHLTFLHSFVLNKNKHKKVLIVTKIMPGSVMEKVNCFYEGALLSTVNGKKVRTLADVRAALKESGKTGFIALETKEKIATAVGLDEVLSDEKRLASEYKFTSTPGMKALMKEHAPVKRAK